MLGLALPTLLEGHRLRLDNVGPPGGSPRWPGDAPPETSSIAPQPILLGALDRALIDRVIKRSMGEIRLCYQRELARDPSLKGKLVVKFVVGSDGSVSTADLKTNELATDRVGHCITDVFRDMVFPEPTGGGIVIVSYPFYFSAG